MAKKSTAQKARDKAAKTRKAIINKPGPPNRAQKARIDKLEETIYAFLETWERDT